ncbi:hypothetical protein NHP21005_16830 [Helicobacter sp. NHP21005]|uniref:hypothetical protein n=1 Tax=Helicobacter felistomachi TaxID=3040201 RepID=UPI002573B078|nr:hypothetical protein [Helicobacter sp. NHP21005]BEG57995.1 hypothetical protein NHP21005_16830 [Helicobacter sp. NHP21005]
MPICKWQVGQRLKVVQDGVLQDDGQALDTINQHILALNADLSHDALYSIRGKRLACLKHPQLDHIGRMNHAIFLYDEDENLNAVAKSAEVLGFDLTKTLNKLKWMRFFMPWWALLAWFRKKFKN